MGCRKSKPQPVSREWGQEGAPARQGGGVWIDEGARVVMEAGGGGEESRVLKWRRDDMCPLSSIL